MKKQNNNEKKQVLTQHKLLRLFFILMIIVTTILFLFLVLKRTGIWQKVNSIQKIKAIVEKGGVFSFLIFIILQILQTTVLQIPAVFVTIAGALIFGKWTAFLLSFIAIMIGSLIMFWIGRKAGRKFLNWIIGEESTNKWIEKLSNGKYLFFLMMVFPVFPDDILCVVAGLTNMSFPFFLWTNVIARGIGVATTVFFGSGAVIPFHGWGLFVWGIILIFAAILFYLSIKYRDKLDEISRAFFKKK